ncbi:nucleoside-diphosphate sugar epimerase/dehydratase [Parenemella sanctibonifatiensis]|uniref:dTDP-glucose 4,6-dehydratase n=1 Tax=Parenemella sanctibonifatiensis TaxID=2016505 RepID=A0A255EMS5_9ACTN|nr:nucleoside-diphosphate sugar epimerase/dehydratase [Parenemella sanctibonifatiensis]OYN92281.1 dTDP-glucose 4,6-dehydratase [Parenemella sanctibonifatiensis]
MGVEHSTYPRTRVSWNRLAVATWDVLAWPVATLAMVAARYDFNLNDAQLEDVLYYALICMVLQGIFGVVSKIYMGRNRLASFEDAISMVLVAAATALVATAVVLAIPPNVPRGLLVTVPVFAVLQMIVGRFVYRAISEAALARNRYAQERQPVLIYGAGEAGRQLAMSINTDESTEYSVAGFIDDDPRKANLRLGRARVVGNRSTLLREAERLGVRTVLVAIPQASKELLNLIDETVVEVGGLRLLTLPPMSQIVGRQVTFGQLKEVDMTELLGRSQVELDLSEVAAYITGKVVLVSGAGGSIGSEIARQVHQLGPAELVMLDRDESGLHSTQLSIYGRGLLDTPDMVLCDIRDEEALDRVFRYHQPQVVFHAAALKHLPMLQQYPEEGWKTNARGTQNMLAAATRYGVERFVNISTDKAADPSSVLGKTKRRAEELTAWFGTRYPGDYISVRFGNVLGSRGSVLHTFAHQIDSGGPVTVVHPDITRFFMTVQEACRLTLQAGAVGNDGEVLVLDMGEPVKILDLANRLIRRSGKEIEIHFTGLREGEKLHEVLFSDGEEYRPTRNPKIRRVEVPPVAPTSMEPIHVQVSASSPPSAGQGDASTADSLR